MPFTAITYYPTAVAGEGANNKKIDISAPAANATTQCVFDTTTTVRFILAKPLASNSATAVPSANQDFGWNILKSDMNNTAGTPNNRMIPAGNWVFRATLTASTADALSASYGVKIYVHKRSALGVNTELFNVISTFVGIEALPLDVAVTKTGVAAITLELDETIHVEYWVQGRGGGSTGLLAQTITFNLGAAIDIVIPSPGIRTNFPRTTDVIGEGLPLRGALETTKAFSLIGEALPTFTKGVVASKTFDIIGEGLPTITKLTQAVRTFDIIGEGLVSASKVTAASKTFNIIGEGLVTNSKVLIASKTFNIIGEGLVSSTKAVVASKTFDVIGEGLASFIKATQAVRTFNVVGEGKVQGRIELPIDKVPEAGAAPVIINNTTIFAVLD